LRVFCQCRAPTSSDRAALSKENERASGSSATSGAGAGTLSKASPSQALAEAASIGMAVISNVNVQPAA
jgi:hypothetical protein